MRHTKRTRAWVVLAMLSSIAGGCGGKTATSAVGSAGNAVGSAGNATNAVAPTSVCDLEDAPLCAKALCGNGIRDVCASQGTQYCDTGAPIVEPCDGPDLGGYTCQDLGFASGTVSCLPSCQGFDTSQCSACTPSPSVIRCGPVLPSAMAFDPSDLAATDSEIALVGIHHDTMGQPASVRFARLTPELDVLSVTPVPEPAIDDSSEEAADGSGAVAVAPLPSGWVLAGSSDLGFFVDALDASGQPIARTTFEQGQTTPDGVAGPLLAARPNGGPLLVWADSANFHAAVVSDDGTSLGAWLDVPLGDNNSTLLQAAFVGDSFYVVSGNLLPRLPPGMLPEAAVQLARISPDGALLGVNSALQGVTGWASIVTGADDLRVYYWDQNALDGTLALVLQSLDPTADAAVSPFVVPLDASEFSGGGFMSTSPDLAIAFGSDTFLMLTGITPSGWHLTTARVDSGGILVGPPSDVGMSVQVPSPWLAATRRGPDAIVAWSSFDTGLQMARVVP